MATVRELAIKVTGDSVSYVDSIKKSKRATEEFYRETKTRADRFNKILKDSQINVEGLSAKMVSLASMCKTLDFGMSGLQNVAKIADDYGQMAIRVKMALETAVGSAIEFNDVQNRLFEMSQRNSRDLAESQELYIKTADAMRTFGLSTEDTLDVIETLNNEFTINAANAQSASSAISALSKAMQKGKVGSQELQSIMSAMPSLMTHIAQSMGDLTSLDVQKMILSGELGMGELLEAMKNLREETSKLADEMPNTIADGVTRTKTAMSKYVGEVNQGIGATELMSKGLISLADNFNMVADAAVIMTGVGISRWIGNTATENYKAAKASIEQNRATKALISAERDRILTLQKTLTQEKAQLEIQKQNIVMAQARSNSMRAQTMLAKELAAVEGKLNAVMNAQTQAASSLTKATKSLSSARKAMSALSGALGGPVGMISMVGLAAASFLTLRGSSDDARESLLKQGATIDDLIRKYDELKSKAEKDMFSSGLSKDAEAEIKKLEEQAQKFATTLRLLAKTEKIAMDDGEGGSVQTWDISAEARKSLEDTKAKYAALIADLKSGKITAAEFNDSLAGIVVQFNEAHGKSSDLSEAMNGILQSSYEIANEFSKGVDTISEIKKINETLTEEQKAQKKLFDDAQKAHASTLEALTAQIAKYESIDDLTKAILFTQSQGFSLISDEEQTQINEAIAKLQQLDAERDKAAKAEKARQEAIARRNREIADEKRRIENEERKRLSDFNALVDSLKTAQEKETEELARQLNIIEQMAETEAQRQELRLRIAEKALDNSAPKIDGGGGNALGAGMIDVADQTAKLNDWYKEQEKKHKEFLDAKMLDEEQYHKKIAQLQEEYQEQQDNAASAMRLATLNTFETMTSQVVDLYKDMGAESSLVYKTMFLANKASAIAQAMVSTNKAAAEALPNIALSNVVRGLGYASVGMIASQTISGMAHDGIDNIPKEGTWLLDKGERVVDARTNADLKDFLSETNKSSTGGSLTINIPINAEGGIDEEDSKQLGETIKQMVKSVIQTEQRPGGLLNKK